jgi:hypothetical protein
VEQKWTARYTARNTGCHTARYTHRHVATQKEESFFILYPYGMVGQAELFERLGQAKAQGGSILLRPV